MRPLACLLMCVFVAPGIAADQVLLINNDGYWLTTVSSSGAPNQVRITHVVDARSNPDDPPPPPPPDDRDRIAVEVERLSRAINDPTTAAALAEVYRIGASNLTSGAVDNTQSLRLVSLLTDTVLNAQNARNKWVPWREKVTDLVTSEVQSGDFGADTLTSVSQGLDDSTDDLAFGDGKILERLLEIIKLLLPFILKFLGGL